MRTTLCILLLMSASASGAVISDAGIDSFGLGLDGSGVRIGEIDIGRSSVAGYDSAIWAASNTSPLG